MILDVVKFREELDQAGCAFPGCTHDGHDSKLYLHARCHPRAALDVGYERGAGVLEVVCHICKKPVATIAVAARGAPL